MSNLTTTTTTTTTQQRSNAKRPSQRTQGRNSAPANAVEGARDHGRALPTSVGDTAGENPSLVDSMAVENEKTGKDEGKKKSGNGEKVARSKVKRVNRLYYGLHSYISKSNGRSKPGADSKLDGSSPSVGGGLEKGEKRGAHCGKERPVKKGILFPNVARKMANSNALPFYGGGVTKHRMSKGGKNVFQKAMTVLAVDLIRRVCMMAFCRGAVTTTEEDVCTLIRTTFPPICQNEMVEEAQKRVMQYATNQKTLEKINASRERERDKRKSRFDLPLAGDK